MTTYGARLEAALSKQILIELAERDMSQKDLAEKMDMQPATLNRYFKGPRWPMPVFFQVAELLELSPAELLSRAEARITE